MQAGPVPSRPRMIAGPVPRRVPRLLVLLGLAVVAGGIVYDVLQAGLPYQDPTPEMRMQWERDARIAALIRRAGMGLVVLGAAGWAWRRIARARAADGAPR